MTKHEQNYGWMRWIILFQFQLGSYTHSHEMYLTSSLLFRTRCWFTHTQKWVISLNFPFSFSAQNLILLWCLLDGWGECRRLSSFYTSFLCFSSCNMHTKCYFRVDRFHELLPSSSIKHKVDNNDRKTIGEWDFFFAPSTCLRHSFHQILHSSHHRLLCRKRWKLLRHKLLARSGLRSEILLNDLKDIRTNHITLLVFFLSSKKVNVFHIIIIISISITLSCFFRQMRMRRKSDDEHISHTINECCRSI